MPRHFNAERTVFSTNVARKTEHPHAKEWSWILTLNHVQQLTQSGSKTKNGKAKTIELLEESIREKFHDIGFGNDFLDMAPKAQETKNR